MSDQITLNYVVCIYFASPSASHLHKIVFIITLCQFKYRYELLKISFEFTVDLQILKNIKVDLISETVGHPWPSRTAQTLQILCDGFDSRPESIAFDILVQYISYWMAVDSKSASSPGSLHQSLLNFHFHIL